MCLCMYIRVCAMLLFLGLIRYHNVEKMSLRKLKFRKSWCLGVLLLCGIVFIVAYSNNIGRRFRNWEYVKWKIM